MSKFIDDLCKKGTYKIAFSDPQSNWDIYINNQGIALSIAKKEGCESTCFGDKSHIIKLIANGFFSDLAFITDYGRTCFVGLYSKFYKDSHGKQFSMMRLEHVNN